MTMGEAMQLEVTGGQPLLVRPLTRQDAAELQAFNAGLAPDTRRKFLPHRYDDETVAKALARSERGDDYTLGLFDGTRLVGYFFLWRVGDRVPLLGIGLADDFQHRGLGRKMMGILMREAEARGRDGVELTTMQDNENAFALYESCGFRYYSDVENQVGDGQIVIERAMFHEIKPGAEPMSGPHAPPV